MKQFKQLIYYFHYCTLYYHKNKTNIKNLQQKEKI